MHPDLKQAYYSRLLSAPTSLKARAVVVPAGTAGCSARTTNRHFFRRYGRNSGLPPHLDEPLHCGDGDQNKHDPHNGEQQRFEKQTKANKDDAFCPFH
jgi:hypothetical protein